MAEATLAIAFAISRSSRATTNLQTQFQTILDELAVAVVGYNEKRRITITGTPTGGDFTLTYAGQTTGAIAYNASAATVQTALEALSNITAGDVVCTGGALPGTVVDVEFKVNLAAQNVAEMTTDGSGLTGGSTPDSAISTVDQGEVSVFNERIRAQLHSSVIDCAEFVASELRALS